VRSAPRTRSAPRSAIIMTGALIMPPTQASSRRIADAGEHHISGAQAPRDRLGG
jgi:hypothetical protein